MKHLIAAPLALFLIAQPLTAEDAPPSMMERGAQLFFEGLMQEMAPAFDDMAALLEETGPALQNFVAEMGPKLRQVLEEVEDWSVYSAPEVLPNGDIIIRRKPEVPDIAPKIDNPLDSAPQIEL